MKFGEKLQDLRQKAGLSQPEFAERVNLSVAAVRDYEQGRRLPGWPAIVRIAQTLGVSVDEFSACDEVAKPDAANDTPDNKPKKPKKPKK